MKAFALTIALVAATFATSTAYAGWNGEISFTAEEKAAHSAGIQAIMNTAVSCLNADLDRHKAFYGRYHISPFYGDRSSFGKLSYEDKLQYIYSTLIQLGYNRSDASRLAPYIRGEMQPTSCVGLVLKCLGNGFKAAGQEALWKRIRAYTDANGSDGTSLQNALQLLGWRVLYWNPASRYNDEWDRIEQEKDPDNHNRFWGYHAYRYRSVMGPSHKYFWNTVDDWTTLVDFNESVPSSFRRVPFFVGTAHTGYHVFPGMFGNVVEGHSTRQITDPQTIESAPFNPFASGGAPRGQYFSGLVAVPPGY